MRRRLALIVAALLAVGAPVGFASVASADPPCVADPRSPGMCSTSPPVVQQVDTSGCISPPTPDVPGRGPIGFLAPTPKAVVTPKNVAPGDVYAIYGWSSLRWDTYDTGCGIDLTNTGVKASSSITTTIANLLQINNIAWGAGASTLLDAVLHPAWLHAFDPLVTRGVDMFRPLFRSWALIAFALTGALIVGMSTRWALRHVGSAVGWAVLVCSVTLTVMGAPVLAAHAFDSGIGSAASVAATTTAGSSQTDPANTAIGAYYSAIFYKQWLNGELGCSECPVAAHYGLQLWDGMHYTLAELKTVDAGGAPARVLLVRKTGEYRAAAAHVKRDDPAAYNVLKGTSSDSRIEAALLTTFGGLCTMPFLLAACLMLIAAFLAFRVFVMTVPITGALGIFPKTRGVFVGAASAAALAAIGGAICFAFLLLDIFITATVLAPETPLPGLLRLIVCAVLQVILWRYSKPHRALLEKVTQPVRKAGGKVSELAQKAAMAYATGDIAGAAAGEAFTQATAGSQPPPPQRAEGRLVRDYTPAPAAPVAAPTVTPERGLPKEPSQHVARGGFSRTTYPPGDVTATEQSSDGVFRIYRPADDDELADA